MLEKIEKGREITGHERFEKPETYTSTIYDSILKNFDYLENKEKYPLNEDALRDVATYAVDCYVGYCEDLGVATIKEIEEMEIEVIEQLSEILKNILGTTSLSNEQQMDIIESYRKEIKNVRNL